jgi:hypothetical protein
MNKENKQRITDLEIAHLRAKYPSVPDYAIAKSKWSDKDANSLTKAVISFLQFNGYQAERINTMGTYRAAKKYTNMDGVTRTVGKGSWTKGTGTLGSADISATIKGRSVKIEIKFGADRQSDHQKEYQKAIEQAGGTYIIVKNFDDFIQWFDTYTK